MGTFHDGLGDLHGMTVAAKLTGGRIAVGRYHEEDRGQLILLGADLHEEGEEGLSGEAFLERAYEVGVWGNHPRLLLPREEVLSIRLLADLTGA